MLIIRNDQVAALDAAMLNSFRGRMAAHLKETLPDQVGSQDDATLTATIDAGIDAARSLGLSAERDVARFVDLVVGLGPSFLDAAETSWTRALLENQRQAPSARLDAVYRQLESRRPDLASVWAAWR